MHENGVPIHGNARLVGIVQWFGRIVHNHHLGIRVAPDIDILKGVNMSFRAAAVGTCASIKICVERVRKFALTWHLALRCKSKSGDCCLIRR